MALCAAFNYVDCLISETQPIPLAREIQLDPNYGLIERCKRQDERAMQQFYSENFQSVFNTANYILRDRVEAEDVMQETFITAFDRLDDLGEESKLQGWLKTIARNKSLNQIKKRRSWNDFDDISEVADVDLEEDTSDLDLTYIYKCIGELPEGYRVILTLFLIEGLDHEEIADHLGITNSTSRSQYTRARQKLREIISDRNERFA